MYLNISISYSPTCWSGLLATKNEASHYLTPYHRRLFTVFCSVATGTGLQLTIRTLKQMPEQEIQ